MKINQTLLRGLSLLKSILKTSFPFVVFLLATNIMIGQDSKANTYPILEDVQTLDGILKAYYDVISGPANSPRDWERDNSLHHPDALISITGKNREGKIYILTQNLDDYHNGFGTPKTGFWEYEVSRKVDQFGNITHVWSTYETKTEKDGPVVARGINSIQLYFDGDRWWILSWMFDSERPDNPIPQKYQ